ncbi:MAG: hypothetical protein VX642_16325 [Bdellovibrionota bacterium]|nr:hypothetical protein [Bdellovibrionota bacterium]
MKKLLVLLAALGMSATASAGYNRPYKGQQEISKVHSKIDQINSNKGGCTSNSVLDFNEYEPIQESNCGGDWTKFLAKDGSHYVKIVGTRCKTVIVGAYKRGRTYYVGSDKGVRYYEMTRKKGASTFNASIRIPDASEVDGDSVVLVTSGSGASCAALPANF